MYRIPDKSCLDCTCRKLYKTVKETLIFRKNKKDNQVIPRIIPCSKLLNTFLNGWKNSIASAWSLSGGYKLSQRTLWAIGKQPFLFLRKESYILKLNFWAWSFAFQKFTLSFQKNTPLFSGNTCPFKRSLFRILYTSKRFLIGGRQLLGSILSFYIEIKTNSQR